MRTHFKRRTSNLPLKGGNLLFSTICFRFSTGETAEKPEKALGSIRLNILCEGQGDIHSILYLKPFSSHIIFQFFMKPCMRYENKNLCVITTIATTALFHIKWALMCG